MRKTEAKRVKSYTQGPRTDECWRWDSCPVRFQSLHLGIALNCMNIHSDNNFALHCGLWVFFFSDMSAACGNSQARDQTSALSHSSDNVNSLTTRPPGNSLYCGVLHPKLWLRQLTYPQYSFSPSSFGNRTCEYQLGTCVWRIKTTFPSLPCNQVRPCDYVLVNEI